MAAAGCVELMAYRTVCIYVVWLTAIAAMLLVSEGSGSGVVNDPEDHRSQDGGLAGNFMLPQANIMESTNVYFL